MLRFEKPLSRSELARALQVDRVTILRMERDGRIPAGVRVSGNRTEFGIAAQMAATSIVEASRDAL
jgi:transcriptional regulator with XRE-family HTH domain